MKKILLSVLAVSVLAGSVNAQSNNHANPNSNGYRFNFGGVAGDNCPTFIPVYASPSTVITSVQNGLLELTKTGANQTANADNFAITLVDESCNKVTVDLTAGIPIEIKVNSSVAVPQILFAVGDGTNYTDMNPLIKPLLVGDNIITGTITDLKSWNNLTVDVTKIGFAVLGFRTSWDDFDQNAKISGVFKIDYIKIGNQTDIDISVNELSTLSNFSIFPSPATSEVNLKFTIQEAATVTLTDITGRVMVSEQVSAGSVSKTYNVSNFAQGLYFVTISGANGQTTEKFMVK